MKTLILYGTKYSCTEECAKMLAEKLKGEVDVYNLKVNKDVDISQYNKVVIGGSIYMGRIQKEVSEFYKKNLKTLQGKKIGLYICCMREGKEAEAELREAFPQELIESAVAKEYFGGQFIFKNMSFMDRVIAKKVAKIDKDTSTISEKKINDFAQLLNNA